MRTDILIIGGGTGGVAAALAAARSGARVVVVEPTDWIGGQFTAQAVPPDENRWVESFGCNRSYAHLRRRVRDWYRDHLPLNPAARADDRLNPGNGWVSRLCASPAVWHAQMLAMLEPHLRDGRLTLLTRHEAVAAELGGQAGERIDAVRVRPVPGAPGSEQTITAACILDATETGDVLELANVEHAIGAEHRSVYGELHGRDDKTHPLDQQACSWCFALEHRPGENHVIDKPARYDFWRSFVPQMRDGTSWTGPLLSWTVPSHNEQGRRTFRLVPWPDQPQPGEWEMWRYRRIADAALTDPPGVDVSLINMVQMDYWLRPLLGVSRAERDAALAEAREQSLSLLYWMQTQAPRHDGDGIGYPGLKLRGDELGTTDGLAKHVYIREPRRLIARTIMHEGHLGTDQRRAEARPVAPGAPEDLGSGEAFADSIAIGHYTIDLHPSCAGRNSVYVPCAPFSIPMGALIPKRVVNLLAAGKCLGVTHVVNASTRMHTTEWAVGEAAGILAAWCVAHTRDPRDVHADPAQVAQVRQAMAAQGVALAWPWDAPQA
jgi:hypothetical protein